MSAFEVVAIILVAVLVWAACRYVYLAKKCHFSCPSCGKQFKPRMAQLIFSMNALCGKVLRCPACGMKTYMEPEKDFSGRK